ncbi:hypothetical protein [Cryptosporangium phraense]|uniref:Uncharacterized protein n=1 Tax=Cryptosporangium phraense TaxID=2593070 RepID=A0A545AJY5_9ACTN|nr:hypothetical protein [Cryptosporangium phraense]TQS41646.1 hypothetical protein FL583_28735 [Cryptosporangium phraense]
MLLVGHLPQLTLLDPVRDPREPGPDHREQDHPGADRGQQRGRPVLRHEPPAEHGAGDTRQQEPQERGERGRELGDRRAPGAVGPDRGPRVRQYHRPAGRQE